MKVKQWFIISLMLIGLVLVLSGCGFNKYTVSGQITDLSGNGVSGVTIAYTGPVSGKVVTDTHGNWTITGMKGTTTITPTKKNWVFSPANDVVKEAATSINFSGVQNAYSIDVSYQGVGTYTIYPKKDSYQPGDPVTLTAVANKDTGWVFSNWTGDLIGSVNPITINMDGDKTITATFVQGVAEIVFDDPDLEKVVRKALNKSLGKITKKDVENLNYLDASVQPISSLAGIEHLTSLTWLDLSVTGLQNISQLSALTGLKYLNLSANEIVDINPLSKLVNLEDLNLSKNKIIDVSAMSWLVDKKLKYLDLSYNQIVDVTSLAALTAVEKLNLSGNKIINIKPLNKMVALKELDLSKNQIDSVNALVNMKLLERLNLAGNKVVNLYDLVWLWSGNLKDLNLSSNGVSELHGISGLTKLEKLNLGANVIADLTKLNNLVNLRELYLSNNQISDITPLGGLTKVEKLHLHKNVLITLEPLLTMLGLKELTLMDNELNLTTGRPAWIVINELRRRGVLVRYDYYQNDAPVIGQIEPNPMTVNENDLVELLISASDPNRDPMTFSAEGELAQYFNPTTHKFTWRPSFDDAGNHSVTFVVSDGEVASSLKVDFIVLNVNRAPVFSSPTAQQQVTETDTLTFNVEATDLDGDAVTITVQGDPALTTRYNSATKTFTWPTTYSDAGVYTLTFTATDGIDPTDHVVTITVVNKNRAPRFEPALVNQTVNEMQQLVYTITGVDDDPEDTLTYSMTSTSPKLATVFDPANRTLTWTPTYDDAGVYNVTFTVSDGVGRLEATQAISITVNNVDRKPYFEPNTLIERSINEYEVLTFKVVAYDDDSDTIAYSVTGLPPNAKASVNPATGDFTWTTTGYDVGVHNLIFRATANGATTDSTPVKVTVVDQLFYPVLELIGNKQVNEMERLSFTVKATDKDVYDTLTYNAIGPLSTKFNATTRVFEWTPSYTEAGDYEVTFQVSDGLYTVSETIQIKVVNVNQLPLITVTNITPSLAPLETETVSMTVVASDPDGDPITYGIEGEPIGTFDYNTHVFTWTPTYDNAGAHTVTFVVSDWQGASKQSITINVQNKDREPVISAISPKTVDEYSTLTIPIIASDPDNDQITYRVEPMPEGATISPSGIFTWKPDYRYVGPNNFTFYATANNVSKGTPVTITVNNLFFTPEITSSPIVVNNGTYQGQENKEIRITFTATDKDNDAMNIEAIGLLADKFTRLQDTNIGVFAWIPDYSAAGSYPMEIKVTDTTGKVVSLKFTVVISNVDRAPVLVVPGLPTEINVGDTLQFEVSATDEDVENVTLSVLSLPAGATFIPAAGNPATGIFEWKPTTANISNTPTQITFKATSGSLSDSETVQILVKGPKLVIESITPADSAIQPGGSVDLTAVIKNTGNTTASTFVVKWAIYQGGNLVRDYLETVVTDLIPSQGSKAVTCRVDSLDLAALALGTYQMRVTADETASTGGPATSSVNFRLVPTQRTLTTVVATGDTTGIINRNPNQPTYDNNFDVTLSAEAKEGYMFSHWVGEVADVNKAVTTVRMDKDQTVYAHFVKITLPNELMFLSYRNGTNGEIFLMDKNGNVNLVFSRTDLVIETPPRWSPTYTKIYFSARSLTSGRTDIYIVSKDGTNLVNLTGNNVSATVNTSPAWSPVGDKMAYKTNAAGTMEIFTRSAIDPNQTPYRVSSSTFDADNPVWSPESNHIIYSTADGAIKIANITNINSITTTSMNTGTAANFATNPAWSPTGDYVAFQSGGNIFAITFKPSVVKYSDWNQPVQVTTNGGSKPVWHPAIAKLGFISERNGSSDIFEVTPLAGSWADREPGVVCLTPNTNSNEIELRWSLDGSKIAYVSNAANSDWELYLMNADGTSKTRLTFSAGADSGPRWGQ